MTKTKPKPHFRYLDAGDCLKSGDQVKRRTSEGEAAWKDAQIAGGEIITLRMHQTYLYRRLATIAKHEQTNN